MLMTKYGGGKFRKRKTSFSMVSNEILRNDTVSLKAKGLYSLIQSYITIENFSLYKGFLASKCKEGKKAFDAAWRELKDAGYLVQYQMQDSETKQFFWEYELLDSVNEKPYTPKGDMGLNSHIPKRDAVDKSIYGKKDAMDLGGINNTVRNNTNFKEYLSNHIISEYEVMEQIGYNFQMQDDFVENIILIMVEVLNMPDDAVIKINQADTSARLVKERFRKIRFKHIEYIKLVFQDFSGEIKSLKVYMITTLYNAPATCDIYFANRVNRDLCKEAVSSI